MNRTGHTGRTTQARIDPRTHSTQSNLARNIATSEGRMEPVELVFGVFPPGTLSELLRGPLGLFGGEF
jgi:hypothetical protein